MRMENFFLGPGFLLELFLLLQPLLNACAFAYNEIPYCHSWQYNVEVNNLQQWAVIPEACEAFVALYATGGQYEKDSEEAAYNAMAYAKNVTVQKDGKDIWVFDIDETCLSNVPYYADHHFGAEVFDEDEFDLWVKEAKAPAVPGSLKLFNELKELGFSLFFLTGRDEYQRNVTIHNLLSAGYSGWKGLILRQRKDQGVKAVAYKSQKRKELEDAGYHIVGNIGDQWSDLTGYSVGDRVFKLPNPMYYIS